MELKTNDDRIAALEKALDEQKDTNKKLLDTLTEVAQGLKVIKGGTNPTPPLLPFKPVGPLPIFKKRDVMPTERGVVVGVCRRCETPVRSNKIESPWLLCPGCGVLAVDEVFYGRLCADCPHVESAHNKGAGCIQCSCVSFRLLETAGVEEKEYQKLAWRMSFLRDPPLDLDLVRKFRETLPAIVFFRAAQTVLNAIKSEPEKNYTIVGIRGIAHEAQIAYSELAQEERERTMNKKIAKGESSPVEEYENYNYRIKQLMDGGAVNTPELRQLTRDAGKAYGLMTPEQRKEVKEALRSLHEQGPAPALAQEALPPLDPDRMRPVVANTDEERTDIHVVFSITRSQYATLEWGLEHATVKEGVHKPEDISELAANLLLPSFFFMLKNIANARENMDKKETVNVPGARQSVGKTASMRKFVEKKQAEGVKMTIYPPGGLGDIMGTGKIPVTDGVGGPKVGEMTTKTDKAGNVIADIDITDPDFENRVLKSMQPDGPMSIGSHVKKSPPTAPPPPA